MFLVVVLALAACGSNPEPPATPSPASTSPAEAPTYAASGCPVADEAFCETAVQVIGALQAGDADRIFELSREDRLVCAEVATEYFPGCETADVLEGHGLSGPDFTVEVVDEAVYRARLEEVLGGLDASFDDELGGGDVRVVGVGTCGPDIPGRRTYHLAWTAGSSEDGSAPERILGSFELTFEDDWRIALWYLGPLEEWEVEQPDPLELAFCEAGLTPWLA
ncbi:MAG TPA: hypothetical protein VID69_00910 [Actinomycetota bacterium]|jgi:hypothetical protein